MTYTYLWLMLLSVSFPLARSFEPKIKYASKWKALFPAIFLTGSFFIIWDVIFTKKGIWGFNSDYLLGVEIINLPIEEWSFFIIVPFASVFIYECVLYFYPKVYFKFSRQIGLGAGIFLLASSILFFDQSYTFWCFLFAGIFLTLVSFINPTWLTHFFIAYAIHLIPFFLINGILTGSGLKSPIVWYNNFENLSIRIVSIPIEDSIYALLLLLMNVTIFEYLKKRFKVSNN